MPELDELGLPAAQYRTEPSLITAVRAECERLYDTYFGETWSKRRPLVHEVLATEPRETLEREVRGALLELRKALVRVGTVLPNHLGERALSARGWLWTERLQRWVRANLALQEHAVDLAGDLADDADLIEDRERAGENPLSADVVEHVRFLGLLFGDELEPWARGEALRTRLVDSLDGRPNPFAGTHFKRRLSDEEVAVVSLLLGNVPTLGVLAKKPLAVVDVIQREVHAIQAARVRRPWRRRGPR